MMSDSHTVKGGSMSRSRVFSCLIFFLAGVLFAEEGQSFIVLHSAPHDESVSRIVAQLHPGAAVTTYKNIVDKVVTEHGVADLRGASIADRTRRLIAIAHPKFRDELERKAREMGYL